MLCGKASLWFQCAGFMKTEADSSSGVSGFVSVVIATYCCSPGESSCCTVVAYDIACAFSVRGKLQPDCRRKRRVDMSVVDRCTVSRKFGPQVLTGTREWFQRRFAAKRLRIIHHCLNLPIIPSFEAVFPCRVVPITCLCGVSTDWAALSEICEGRSEIWSCSVVRRTWDTKEH